ncbi:hypothetical protein PUN28_019800 [Cardiocondyla obscurior]|uniref:MIF4G domain-containing protein n=1 Tax=Cardiocondyla obscurior TaxID=286306 RepID=A0AAW2E8C9_9HYME
MTSFGRGRGWSSHSQDKEQILRRPGEGSFDSNGSTNKILKDILDKLITFDEREIALPPQLIKEIIQLLTLANNKNCLKQVCDALCKQATYHCMTTKIAMMFSEYKVIILQDNNNCLIRQYFLSFLQDNYQSKDKDRMEDRQTFANKVLLHSEVYNRMRLYDGNRVEILAKPLIDYLMDLLQDNPKDNIYFIMIQILRVGKDFHKSCPEDLKTLIMAIRQLLVKENLHSPENYAILLLVIELANNNYEITDTQLKQFYMTNIKSLSFNHPFSLVELKVVPTKTENENQLREIDNNQQIVKEDVKNDVSERGNYSKNTNVPRAIRGSGALDKSKKGSNVNAKQNSLKLTPPREKNKGWGHDDRFHEHYE